MDIKVQLVFGKEAATDQRENPVGKEQGDHHRTIREWRVDDVVGERILAAISPANDRMVEAGKAQFDVLREQGVLDDVLSSAAILMGESVDDAEFFGILTRGYTND